MQVCILGSLEVRSDAGAVVVPAGYKQRVLLASLLLQAPRVVSSDRLIDALWADQLPDDAGAALRTQVFRLRSLLGSVGGGGRLQRGDETGYQLVLERGETDAGLFEELQARARDASAPERRLALVEEALALWRGEPFGELSGLLQFQGEVARLRELHDGACERRIASLLALGRTAEALSAVEERVHADPLRERPRALQMQALYQAGRQHEALASFQEYRRLLSEELGLDPSPALRALESEILQHAGPVLSLPSPVRVTDAETSSGNPRSPESGAPSARARIPLVLAPLIGREDEMAAVHRLLRSTRLVTLTGPGGSGKTRIALEVAHGMEGDVQWVELGAVADPDFLVHEVAATLGIREHPGQSRVGGLVQALQGRSLTLVLDNCEHLIDSCAAVVGALLRDCADLTVLTTSREPLGITGEAVWPVPPLRLPERDTPNLDELARCESVRLFCLRAQSAVPSFALTEENRAAAVEICHRLDGMPLALELAAARVRHLSPTEIARRLETSFDLLSGGGRSALPRHHTLHAAIDWSYQLLTEEERRLFEHLSVFSGGYTLDAAEQVWSRGRAGWRQPVLDLLSSLVDKSLVLAGGEAMTRYRMLETVRAFARERLLERPHSEESALRRRHAEYFAVWAEEADPLLVSAARAETGRRLAADHENLRSALSWALANPDGAEVAHRLAGSLWWFWHYVGGFEEARRWAEATLALPEAGVPDRLRARVRYTAAMACWLLGDPAAACAHAAESTRIARALNEPTLLVRAISAHAFALRDVGKMAPAKALAAECVAVARAAGFPPTEMGFALWIQCTALLNSGEVESAETAAREAETLWRATGDRWGLSMVLHGMGMAELGRGAWEAAASRFSEAVALLRRDGEPYFVARSIEGLAIVRVYQGDLDRASRLFGAAEAIRETIGAPLLAFEEARYRQTVAILVPRLESQKRETAWAEGRSMTLDEAVEYSLVPAGSLPAAGPPL